MSSTIPIRPARPMTVLLSAVFFLSGAAGLAFETLWFRQAGLTFGNSIWASSLVLSGFMGGLALGNALAIRYGERIRRPLLAYGVLEATVAVVGIALVLAFPVLPGLFAPLFRPLLDQPLLLNPLRFGLAFLLLLLPTTAMGATLPLMVKVLNRWRPGAGRVLGWLYGWNTLGAMTGAILAEEVLIEHLGVLGAATAAGSLNLIAAAAAIVLSRRSEGLASVSNDESVPGDRATVPTAVTDPPSVDLRRLLLAAALAGGILLALEVVWFRFLQLFVVSTTRVFALMLVVVLAGIGIGGLTASAWLRYRPQAYRLATHLALGAGLFTVLTYIRFDGVVSRFAGAGADLRTALELSLHLMLPVSWASGLLFTFFGRAAFDRFRAETRAVGWVTLANTAGAMLGAVAGGWILLPGLGIERSIFVLALLYGAVAVLAPYGLFSKSTSRMARLVRLVLLPAFAVTLLLYPFGLMRNHYVPTVVRPWLTGDGEIAGFREGLTETIIYLEERFLGEPVSHKLLTNSFSMSATNLTGKRYMKHFVYWPLAFHPEVEDALLISYGVGVTAKALTDSPEIAHIDIVDISRDILEMNDIVYPEPGTLPLDDPRVEVWVEDGRFFLLTTDRSYDLITAEPPPLKIPGVVNLYTQEYFELLASRLEPGGYVTYWLPVDLLTADDTRSIIKAFCNVFDDCSLWRGIQMQLVLVGSNGAAGPIDGRRFARQWRDPAVAEELTVLGFERPELLVTTFVADREFLQALTVNSLPLVDNYPYRLSRRLHTDLDFHYRILDPKAVIDRYRSSTSLQDLLPPELFAAGADLWPIQTIIDTALDPYRRTAAVPLDDLDRLLTETDLHTAVSWLLGDFLESTSAIENLAARGSTDPRVLFHQGVRAMANRKFEQAAEIFAQARAQEPTSTETDPRLYEYAILAHAYAGNRAEAQDLLDDFHPRPEARRTDPNFWTFTKERFNLQTP